MLSQGDRTERSDRGNRRVLLQEVGPRDGLQNEPQTLSPETRADLIERLLDTGLPRIQIGSFVNPRKVPQMAGTGEVWQRLRHRPNVRYSALVLNQRGLETALAEGIPHVEIYVSASETHSLKNVGVTIGDALAEAVRMVETALRRGAGVTAGVMCAFGCFYEGSVPLEKVRELVGRFDAVGPVEIGLADTAGLGEPERVKSVIESVVELVGADRLTVHLHDTRGTGLANLRAALDAGVRYFDASVGGLGGCPFIPGAAGNIATEAACALLESLGYTTGVDVAKVTEVGKHLAEILGGLPASR